MKVEIEGPDEFSGAMLSTINRRRGMISGNTTEHGITKVIASVPLVDMFGYSNELRSMTQGKATFTMEFASYAAVPAQVQEELVKQARDKEKEAGRRAG